MAAADNKQREWYMCAKCERETKHERTVISSTPAHTIIDDVCTNCGTVMRQENGFIGGLTIIRSD